MGTRRFAEHPHLLAGAVHVDESSPRSSEAFFVTSVPTFSISLNDDNDNESILTCSLAGTESGDSVARSVRSYGYETDILKIENARTNAKHASRKNVKSRKMSHEIVQHILGEYSSRRRRLDHRDASEVGISLRASEINFKNLEAVLDCCKKAERDEAGSSCSSSSGYFSASAESLFSFGGSEGILQSDTHPIDMSNERILMACCPIPLDRKSFDELWATTSAEATSAATVQEEEEASDELIFVPKYDLDKIDTWSSPDDFEECLPPSRSTPRVPTKIPKFLRRLSPRRIKRNDTFYERVALLGSCDSSQD